MIDFYTRYEDTKLQDNYMSKIIYKTDSSYYGDEYELKVNYLGEITITANNERSKSYALESLEDIIRDDDILICTLHDRPDFKLRGIIEGFYGVPYSFSKRHEVIDFCKKTRLNTYFYAPKDDSYHRHDWKKPYPDDILKKIEELINYAQDSLIDFYFCIAPGNDFDYLSSDDYKDLYQKLKQIINLNVTKFALLMDDIPLKLNDEQTKKFETVGNAHAHLCNEMYEFLKNEVKDFEMLMCPTDYFQLGETPYRLDLMKSLNKEIGVFWTGYNTVSEKIDEAQSKKINEVLSNNLYLWDNYPVNDFNPKDRVYLGAITNRSVNLSNYHLGYVCNPSELWNLSKLPLFTMAQYAYDSRTYVEEDSLNEAIETLILTKYQKAFKTFCWYNESSVLSESHYDFVMKKCYQNSDFKTLKRIYKEMDLVSKILRTYPDKDLLEEMLPLLDYMDLEISLFKMIQKKKIKKEVVEKMQASKYKISNQEILKYIINNNLVDYEIKISEKRMNYWRYIDEEKL